MEQVKDIGRVGGEGGEYFTHISDHRLHVPAVKSIKYAVGVKSWARVVAVNVMSSPMVLSTACVLMNIIY